MNKIIFILLFLILSSCSLFNNETDIENKVKTPPKDVLEDNLLEKKQEEDNKTKDIENIKSQDEDIKDFEEDLKDIFDLLEDESK